MVLFGKRRTGKASPSRAITLTNAGSAALNVSSAKLTGPDRHDFAVDSGCVAAVAPRAKCLLFVRFAPKRAGTRAAVLHIVSNSSAGPVDVGLIGTGLRHRHKKHKHKHRR